MSAPLKAEQRDRDAAADLMTALFGGVPGLERDAEWAATVRRGEDDGYPVVQAFVRSRVAQSKRLEQVLARGTLALQNGVVTFEPTDPDAARDLFSLLIGEEPSP